MLIPALPALFGQPGPFGPFTASIAPVGSGFRTQTVTVSGTITSPPIPFGPYAVVGTASVAFSSDSQGPAETLTASGDTVICFAEELSAGAGIPRLDMQLINTPELGECAPGDQLRVSYLITNNDPTESVTLTVTATSGQNARMPTTDGAVDSAYAISEVNDDFPIVFTENLPQGGLVPLPADPQTFTQPDINKMITIAPLSSTTVSLAIRTHRECLDGSCAETTMVAAGTFSPSGDDASACAGTSINVNSMITWHVPAVSEWGLAAMVLLVLVTGSIVFRRLSARRLA